MKIHTKAQLTEGSVAKLLVKLTIPMILGLFSMMAFNLADTYFIGRLGTKELAAMSFTFPIVMIITSLSLGLGVGASAVISRAIGEGDQHKVQRLTTDSLVLSVMIVTGFVVIGLFTIHPVFRFLGATSDILPLIRQYMLIWYPGMVAIVIPMVGNNAIRATGDTKTPSMIMLVAVFVNIVLDPLLIFGIGPFPRLELAGAAVATVFARTITLCVSFWVLYHREKMITFALPTLKAVLNSWKQVLYIGLPTAATSIILPMSDGIITKFIAAYSAEAVAGFGVATRVQMFVLIVIMALASVLGPFVGQNWGAKKYNRVMLGIRYSQQFSVGLGIATFIVLAITGKFVASVFNDDPTVIATVMRYFWIVPIGYGGWGVLRLSTTALSVLNRPLHSALLTITQAFVFYIPSAYVGSNLLGLKGIFSAAALSYILAGLAAHFWLKKYLLDDQQRYSFSEI